MAIELSLRLRENTGYMKTNRTQTSTEPQTNMPHPKKTAILLMKKYQNKAFLQSK